MNNTEETTKKKAGRKKLPQGKRKKTLPLYVEELYIETLGEEQAREIGTQAIINAAIQTGKIK